MANLRPAFIDLDSTRATSSASSRFDITSPRIQHFDGDVPPALSPLDAFAAHSRKLAKELEETKKAGERRLSRLTPQHVVQSLNEHQQNRPHIFRALSSENDAVPPLPEQFKSNSGNNAQVLEPPARPVSSYPRYSAVLTPDDQNEQLFYTPAAISDRKDYFGIPPSESPPPLDPSRSESSLAKDRAEEDCCSHVSSQTGCDVHSCSTECCICTEAIP